MASFGRERILGNCVGGGLAYVGERLDLEGFLVWEGGGRGGGFGGMVLGYFSSDDSGEGLSCDLF